VIVEPDPAASIHGGPSVDTSTEAAPDRSGGLFVNCEANHENVAGGSDRRLPQKRRQSLTLPVVQDSSLRIRGDVIC
jgi:hypothetical protein